MVKIINSKVRRQTIDEKFRTQNLNPTRESVLNKKIKYEQQAYDDFENVNVDIKQKKRGYRTTKLKNSNRLSSLKKRKRNQQNQQTIMGGKPGVQMIKTVRIYLSILSWYLPLYLIFQLPIGLISTAAFGTAAIVDFSDILSYIPEKLLGFTILILLAYAIIVVLIIYMILAVNNIKMFGGKKSGLKIFVLSLVFAGMFIPFVNMLPLHLFLINMILLKRPRKK